MVPYMREARSRPISSRPVGLRFGFSAAAAVVVFRRFGPEVAALRDARDWSARQACAHMRLYFCLLSKSVRFREMHKTDEMMLESEL